MPHEITDWYNLHSKTWGSLMHPSATSHPAKVKIKLAEHIYKHAIEEGWIKQDGIVIDPFCGVAGFACHSILNGFHFIGVELESRFCEAANKNIELWMKKFAGMPHLGTAVVLRGDSRKLKEVLGGGELHNLLCSSPPFLDQFPCQADDYTGFEHVGTVKQGVIGGKYADDTEGNLGSMPTGDIILSSPPYASSLSSQTDGIDWSQCRDSGKIRDFTNEPGQAVRLHMGKAYSGDKGNLGNLPEGNVVISSPPYEGSILNSQEHGIHDERRTKDYNDIQTAYYGHTDGQLGAMKSGGEDVNKLTSSPPYVNMVNASGEGPGATHYGGSDAPSA